MKKIIYGNGKVHTQRGLLDGKDKCLTITEVKEAQPIGATLKEWPETKQQKDCDVILVFKNIESAHTLQDELAVLIADWAAEIAGEV